MKYELTLNGRNGRTYEGELAGPMLVHGTVVLVEKGAAVETGAPLVFIR